MSVQWVALEDLRDGILAGRLHSPSLVIAVLAALAAQRRAGTPCRPRMPLGPSTPATPLDLGGRVCALDSRQPQQAARGRAATAPPPAVAELEGAEREGRHPP